MSEHIVVVGHARTPMGGLQGELASCSASHLGGTAIRSALERSSINRAEVDEVLMGCVLPAGQGQAPARQAAFHAGLPDSVPCTTVNKMCGSGMKTAMSAYDQLKAENGTVVVAGGMESMTNAPHLLPAMRSGTKAGHGQVYDHMFLDGLEDAYDKGRLMGTFAEDCAEKYQFTREDQDAYAISSLERALSAQKKNSLTDEITPVAVKTRGGDQSIDSDEQPRNARPDKIPTLKPAFRKDGSVTAANASSISDGASALVLMRESDADGKGTPKLARILGHTSYAHAPGWFTTAPVSAINMLLEKVSWKMSDVDLWEINEAFAVVPMAAERELGVPREQLNVHGGACALGHPIGASGARIIGTLINALSVHGQKKGIAAICIGGGEATAMAVELV